MQRFIMIRFLQSLLTLWVMSVIVFSLARFTGDPLDVLAAIRLSKATVTKMKQNLFWAAIYNVIAIPVAAGVLYPFGILLRPEVGALAMSASSITVATNAVLLKSVEKKLSFIQAPLEGGALVHYNGLYYVMGSHLTGWRPNPNVYATSPSLSGPWTEFKGIAPPETNTYGSQSTLMLKIAGSKKTAIIYMGDIWRPKALWDS